MSITTNQTTSKTYYCNSCYNRLPCGYCKELHGPCINPAYNGISNGIYVTPTWTSAGPDSSTISAFNTDKGETDGSKS